MTTPKLDPPDEPDPELLDRYAVALQAEDVAEQERLLALDPGLTRWKTCLAALHQLAGAVSDVASRAPQIVTTPESVDATVRISAPRPQAGHLFGKFEIEAELGRGGMGIVYRARQTDLSRVVALKLLTAGTYATEDQRRRFLGEAQLAARIRHPHIVAIHEAGELHGQLYFTMDLIHGSDLASLLQSCVIPIRDIVSLMITIAEAVQHLHDRGILHRDLKPSNILIDEAGDPFLMDFGLARGDDSTDDPTMTGTVMGTPSYMPPEQAAGRVRQIDARSDVYSLGAIFYELLCGRPPFVGESRIDTLLNVLEREPLPPRHWNPQLPRDLERICLRCLEKDPDRRYPSAALLSTDLTAWLRGDRISFHQEGWLRRLSRERRRYPAAGYRLAAQLATLLAVVSRVVVAPEAIGYYVPIILGLLIWAGLSIVWEWRSLLSGDAPWTPYAFTLTDVLMLTALLQASAGIETPLVAGYPLLVCIAGLWLNVRLVRVASLAALLGYGCLLLLASTPPLWHVAMIVAVVILSTAAVSEFQVQRLSLATHIRSGNLRSGK